MNICRLRTCVCSIQVVFTKFLNVVDCDVLYFVLAKQLARNPDHCSIRTHAGTENVVSNFKLNNIVQVSKLQPFRITLLASIIGKHFGVDRISNTSNIYWTY